MIAVNTSVSFATLLDRGAEVWSLDADFERLGKLKLVPLHRLAAGASA